MSNCCIECGAPLANRRAGAEFCCSPCRMAFANRRAERGAQLYDLFMLTRFQRDDAGKIGAASLMRNLASHWRQDDITRRAGRRSWTAAPKVIDRLNWARANVVNRTS